MLGAELYGLADVVYLALVLRGYLSAALSRNIPFTLLTDYVSHFNVVIGSSKNTTQKGS